MDNKTRLGFIGLGTMGLPMAVNLLKSGLEVVGFNRSLPARQSFAAAGGTASDTIDEVIGGCDVIFLCLPTNDSVKQTVEKIISLGARGTVIADMGSTSPGIIKALCADAEKKGIAVLDCPVSGGQSGAVAGTLSIMCGGNEDAFARIKPLLRTMGTTVTLMGPSGCGSTAKLANNMMVGAHLSAMAESYAFAVKAGIDPSRLFEAIKNGFAQSAVMDAKVPKMLARDFSASARIEIHMKDIKNALELAKETGVELPLTELVLEQMTYLADNGMAKEDQCAMVKYYENTMGVTVE